MAAGKNVARSRRSAAASRHKPLTEAQVAEVRQLALSMRGAARSVKMHGVVVYLDKGESQSVASPRPTTPAGAQSADGAARPQKPDDGLTARKRRSRRRLEERIAQRDAGRERQERRSPPQGGDGPAAEAATEAQAERPGRPPPNSSRPAPTAACEGPPATTRAPHPARAKGQPARGKTPAGGSRGRGTAAVGRGGQGGRSREEAWPRSARWTPAAGMRPMVGRDDSSVEYSDDSGPTRYPEDEIDSDCL